MSRPAKAGATGEVRPPPPTPLWRCLSSTPKAGGFTAAAASADGAMRAGRVPRMPRWLRQPRHGSRAWYCPFTLASGSDPRHESRVAKLAEQDQEVPPEQVGLVLDGLAAPARLEHVEQLAVARFLARCDVVVEGVEELVDDARDLALRNHQVAATERAVPVGSVWSEHVQDAFRDAAIAPRPDHAAEDSQRIRRVQGHFRETLLRPFGRAATLG